MIITIGVQNRDFCYLDFLLVFLVTYILFLYLYMSFDVPSFIIITANYLIEIKNNNNNNNNNNVAIRRVHVLRSNTQPETEIKFQTVFRLAYTEWSWLLVPSICTI